MQMWSALEETGGCSDVSCDPNLVYYQARQKYVCLDWIQQYNFGNTQWMALHRVGGRRTRTTGGGSTPPPRSKTYTPNQACVQNRELIKLLFKCLVLHYDPSHIFVARISRTHGITPTGNLTRFEMFIDGDKAEYDCSSTQNIWGVLLDTIESVGTFDEHVPDGTANITSELNIGYEGAPLSFDAQRD